jgi:NAD(P)H dehydrogenase (quinone)
LTSNQYPNSRKGRTANDSHHCRDWKIRPGRNRRTPNQDTGRRSQADRPRSRKETGVFAIPGAAGKVAYIAHQDVAAAIVGAMTGNAMDNTIYELTGPEALDADEIAGILSQVLGRETGAVDAPPEDFAATFRSLGMPEFAVEGLVSIYAASAAGEYAQVSDDVRTLAGRPARSLRDYITDFMKK